MSAMYGFFPNSVRIGFTKDSHGYMYFVDAQETECLDIARGLWLMGCDYIVAYVTGVEWVGWKFAAWEHMHISRERCKGGYSNG